VPRPTVDITFASPDTAGAHPAVLLVHEAWGVTDDMRAMASRFADHGYVAAVPDLYSAGARAICLTQVLVDYSRGCRGATLDRLDEARQALAARHDVDPDRLAVFGVCMGGGFALAFAVDRGLRAAAVNYGKVPRRADELRGVCPVVAAYGKRDLVYRHHADRLEAHLTQLGVPHDVRTYDTAGHSFLSRTEPLVARLPSPMRVGYDEAAAEHTWRRIFDFFEEHV
jgi:carboxymethylenebutenolidase